MMRINRAIAFDKATYLLYIRAQLTYALLCSDKTLPTNFENWRGRPSALIALIGEPREQVDNERSIGQMIRGKP